MKTQQTKYICKMKSSVRVGTDISTSTSSQRFRDLNNASGASEGLEIEGDCVDILKAKVS